MSRSLGHLPRTRWWLRQEKCKEIIKAGDSFSALPKHVKSDFRGFVGDFYNTNVGRPIIGYVVSINMNHALRYRRSPMQAEVRRCGFFCLYGSSKDDAWIVRLPACAKG